MAVSGPVSYRDARQAGKNALIFLKQEAALFANNVLIVIICVLIEPGQTFNRLVFL